MVRKEGLQGTPVESYTCSTWPGPVLIRYRRCGLLVVVTGLFECSRMSYRLGDLKAVGQGGVIQNRLSPDCLLACLLAPLRSTLSVFSYSVNRFELACQ